MAEIKNTFLQGKMNKDLDSRVLPKGEYREAQNILINESEDGNVGAIENVFGNKIPYTDQNKFLISKITQSTPASYPGSSTTNYTLTGSNALIQAGQTVKAFSGTDIALDIPDDVTVSSINGVNLVLSKAVKVLSGNTIQFGSSNLEVIGSCLDLKNKRIVYFVTDYNEGDVAIRSMTYPSTTNICRIVLYDTTTDSVNILVEGNFLNFSKSHRITGVNIIDDLVFWTDNRNQPRKINIAKALTSPTHYQYEEQISVAKVAPYMPIQLVDSSGNSVLSRDTSIKSDYLRFNFVRFSYRYKFEDGEYSTIAPFTQILFEPLNSGVVVESDNAKNATGSGTSAEEPRVATSKQNIYKKTTVDIMQNKINQAELRVPLPSLNEHKTSSGTWSNDLKITNIEILSKESDGPSVKVVKDIKVSGSGFTGSIEQYTIKPKLSGDTYYRYNYKFMYRSEKPFKTLPEDQITRVYDQVPLRAQAQEISGNRLIYGNYTEHYNYPIDSNGNKGVNYTINSTVKSDHEHNTGGNVFNYGFIQYLNNQYKYHSIKQRRTYQVGIVFSDRFGRQSPVLLSTNTDADAKIKDTYTVPATTADLSHNFNSSSWSWSTERSGIIGKSLDITFRDDAIAAASDIFEKATSGTDVGANYNPHGWYSWRVVVKQSEQEYYNIYTSHAADGWNNVDSKRDATLSGSSWLSLYGDNIDKVPRDVRDVDSTREGVSGSRVRLFLKVVSDANGQSVQQSQNATDLIDVVSLGTAKDQNLYFTDNDNAGIGGYNVLGFVYGADKNPLIAELPNLKHLGTYDAGVENRAGVLGIVDAATTDSNTFVLTTNVEAVIGNAGDLDGCKIVGGNINTPDGVTLTVASYADTNRVVTMSNSIEQSLAKGDKIFFTRYNEGLSVYETEPFESKLDIYYETSTCGLIKDLNDRVAEGNVGPTNIAISDTSLEENTANNGAVGSLTATGVGALKIGSGELTSSITTNTSDGTNNTYTNATFTTSGDGVGGAITVVVGGNAVTAVTVTAGGTGYEAGDTITVATSVIGGSTNLVITLVADDLNSTFDWDLVSFKDGLGADVSSKISVASNGAVTVSGSGAFAFANNTRDAHKLKVKCTELNTYQSTKELTVNVVNSAPTCTGVPASKNLVSNPSSGTVILNCSATNGAKLSSESTTGLTPTFTFGSSSFNVMFVISISNGQITLKTSSHFSGTTFFAGSPTDRRVTITVTDAHGSSVNGNQLCQVNELQNRVSGNLIQASYNICSTSNSAATWYVSRGTNSTDPQVLGGWVQLRQGDVLWINNTTETASTGFFRFVDYGSGNNKYGYSSGANGSGAIQTC